VQCAAAALEAERPVGLDPRYQHPTAQILACDLRFQLTEAGCVGGDTTGKSDRDPIVRMGASQLMAVVFQPTRGIGDGARARGTTDGGTAGPD